MGLKKLRSIVNGYSNYLFPSKLIEELAHERAKICSTCEHCVEKKVFKVLNDKENKTIEGAGCGLCGCPLSAKVRSVFESCADNPKRWS